MQDRGLQFFSVHVKTFFIITVIIIRTLICIAPFKKPKDTLHKSRKKYFLCCFLLQTISNVLLSYADIISKLFANYVTMEKVVSGQRHNDPMWFFHRWSHFILFAKNRKPTFGINIKTCACVRFFLALHPDQQHPAAEGAAGEDVWSHGWKRCERLFSTRKQPKLRLFNYSDIVPNASISAMCYYYPITQPPVNPNSWVSLCVFIVAF